MRRLVFIFLGVLVAPAFAGNTDNWRELTEGKTMLVATRLLSGPPLFGGSKDGLVDWDKNETMSRIATEGAREKYPERNKVRYKIWEDYAGSADKAPIPEYPNAVAGMARVFFQNVPAGAKKVLILRIYDVQTSKVSDAAGLAVVAFDDIPMDVLRRLAIEKGFLKIAGIKSGDTFNQEKGYLVSGSVSYPMVTKEAVLTGLNGLSLDGRADTQTVATGGGTGAMVGADYGHPVVGTVMGGLAGAVASILGSSRTLYQATYQVNGEKAPRTTLQGTWLQDAKVGDRVTITRGSFFEKVEKASF